MKRITYWLPLSIFITSQIFRIMHWPGSALLLIVVPLLQFVFAVIGLVKFKKEKDAELKLTPFALGILYLYLVYDLLMWPGQFPIFSAAILFTLVVFVINVIKVKRIKLPSFILIVLFCFSVFLFIVPASKQFEFFGKFDMQDVGFQDNNSTYWLRYSWMLYIEGKKSESLEALEKATQIECSHEDNVEMTMCNDYKKVKSMINQDSWTYEKYTIILEKSNGR